MHFDVVFRINSSVSSKVIALATDKEIMVTLCVCAGLTALRSEEVYDLMMKDYPDKYHVSTRLTHLL